MVWPRRVLLIGISAASLLAPFVTGTVLAAPIHDATPPEVDARAITAESAGTIAVVGHVVNSAGRRVSAKVAVLAWPTEAMQHEFHNGDKIPTPTVGFVRTFSDGSFQLHLNRGSVPKEFLSSAGQLNVQLVAWSGSRKGSWMMSISARPDGSWRSLDATDPAPTVRLTQENAPTGSVEPALGGGCAYILQSTYTNLSNVAAGYPYGSHTSWATIASSVSQTVGAAASATGAFGSWSANGTLTTTDGFDFTWMQSTAFRLYDTEVAYGKYQYICTNGYKGGWEYNPRFPTGGTTTQSTSYPTWGGVCSPVSAGDWTRNQSSGSDFYMSGGVSAAGVIGINLSVDSSYASNHSLSYHLNADGHICGNNNYPAQASLMKSTN